MERNRKRLYFKKNIRLRERMLLIYIIGGIIPFIGIGMYTNHQIGADMVSASKTSQQEMVSMLSAEIDRVIPIAERLAERLYADKELQRIIETKYEEDDELQRDYAKIEEIKQYQPDYEESISNIAIYVKNHVICYEKPFVYLDTDVMDTPWYKATCQADQGRYWGYKEEENRKYIQFSRVLENESGEQIGIVAIQINSSLLEKHIRNGSMNSMLLLNDQNVILTNFEFNSSNRFLLEQIQSAPQEAKTLYINRRVDEYLLTYQRIYPQTSDASFTMVCFQDYQHIKGQLNRISLDTYFVTVISLLISVLMIIGFYNAFGVRLQTLRRQMHLVANGRYGEVKPITGNDEVAEIYQEVEKMMADIQDLTSNMVEEKVQKEKLHTRQKEVEFKMLASQINPHFLYNTLETIRMKARVNGQKEIEDLVKMLAKIMRRNIQVSNQMVTLNSEIELTENYLKIQDYRFGDRIESCMVVDPEVDLEMEVMPLIIQPFVENAFVHGLEAMSEQGKLSIEITQNQVDVVIRIIDNGGGMPYYKLGDLRHILNTGENADQTHIGINNVNQRLKIQYGDEYGVRIDSQEHVGTTIELRFPKNHNFSGKNV